MRSALNKGRVLFTVWFAHMSAYRAEIIIWMLAGSVPLIMMAVWIAKAQASGGATGGFTPSDFAAYFLAAWLTQQIIVAWVAWELDHHIRQGHLSPKLLRPLDPFWEFFMGHASERFVRLPFMLVILFAGLILVPGTRLTPDAGHVLAYAACASLAFTIRFLIAYSIGLLAFWFDQATALDEFYYVAAAFLTGTFAPLEFYPPFIQAAVEWTPFPYLVYYPVRVLTGAADTPEILRVLGVQLAWLLVMTLVRALLWKQGLKRYGAVGA
ncbi:MAG: ABC-2 family transporter protein [Chloroflexota bacterium]|nr:ABC-2 family transporter protein [Chloroflexota bacterium]